MAESLIPSHRLDQADSMHHYGDLRRGDINAEFMSNNLRFASESRAALERSTETFGQGHARVFLVLPSEGGVGW